MKKYYHISRIAKMYGIGPDTLRYYEKLGIVNPVRGENGYRLYRLQDMYRLNIVRDLRYLGFSMAKIKTYLDELSLDNTLEMLQEETEIIQAKQAVLKKREASLDKRMKILKHLRTMPVHQAEVRYFDKRYALKHESRITQDEAMDFAVKQLHHQYEKQVSDFGNQLFGALVDMDAFHAGYQNIFNAVFFMFDEPVEDADFVLEEGMYLSSLYRGSYQNGSHYLNELLEYADRHDYQIQGQPYEIYWIDNRDTGLEEEFLTEIQIGLA